VRKNEIISENLSSSVTLQLVEAKEYQGKIFVYAGSSLPQGIYILIIDPLGRKIGYDFIEHKICNDVENTNYSESSIDDFESGTPGPKRVEIEIMKAIKGEYKIEIFGKEPATYGFEMHLVNTSGIGENKISDYSYISSQKPYSYRFYFDPTPGAPPPTLTKVVTFQTLRDDFNVALKLNQIGDEKYVRSLIRMVDIAEMLSNRCINLNDKEKPKCYRASVVILRLIMKRLEVVNRLCNEPKGCLTAGRQGCKAEEECNEEEAFKAFDAKYRKDKDLKEFFEIWDKDEWHKHKKQCKKFVTDEALEIISSEINWLIKGFGEEVWKEYKENHKPYIPEKYKKFFK